MKKIFTLFSILVTSISVFSQRLLTEDFNYNTGTLTASNGGSNAGMGNWINISGSTAPITVVAGSLTYPNYFTNPTPSSNKIQIVNTAGSAEDIARLFTAQTTGSIYCSMLFKLLSTDVSNLAANSSTTGEYFTAFSPSTSATAYITRIYIRQGSAPNTVNFGVSAISNTNTINTPTVWITTNYAAENVHLITFGFTYVPGTNNDLCKLWIDQPYSATEPTPQATCVNTETETANIANVTLRQNGAFSPNADIDAIKVSTSFSDATLPLNLTSFTGSLVNKAAVLNWTSTNELNVKGFAVEKGLNGVDFSEIAFVNAKNSANQNEYSLEDINVKGGANYYRLKMVDKDGSSRYSSVVLVNNNAVLTAQVFPNPANGNLTVTHVKAVKGASIKILDLNGKLLKVYPVQAGATQTGLAVTELVKGNYVVVFENNGGKAVTQFSKQ